MNLFPTEPPIEMYQDGFPDADILDRKPTAARLSELVDRIDDPMVIALDGPWGSGKSFFLKCWVGEHLNRKDNTAQTVYFDAFAHDYLDDPLIALTGAVADRLEEAKGKWAKAGQTLKAAAFKTLPILARVGLAAASFGATEAANALGDAMTDQVKDDSQAAIDAFWKKEDSHRAAMAQFGAALTHLTAPDDTGTPTRKLVIVIDELDRCRPDYALSLLEIIKHFFAVPGVHFILGVNLTELENSVKARYGAGISSKSYLQKFIHYQIDFQSGENGKNAVIKRQRYLDHVLDAVQFEDPSYRDSLGNYFYDQALSPNVALRDIERIVTKLILAPQRGEFASRDRMEIAVGVVILSVMDPRLLDNLCSEGSEKHYGELCASLCLGTLDDPKLSLRKKRLNELWVHYLSIGIIAEIKIKVLGGIRSFD